MKRVQRRRAKGFKLPPNTICVDRTSKWGNPFVVGIFGTKEQCISAHILLLQGNICACTNPSIEKQKEYYWYVSANIYKLRDKNVACFCQEGTSCHGDILIQIANQ